MNSPTATSSGVRGPLRSLHGPASTMPTTPVASGPANANAYREAPSSASETVGMTVVTASDSNATMKISATMLQVVVRSSRQSLIGRARRARGTPWRSRSGRRRRRARSAIHRCSESAPRFLPTTRCASPPGSRRPSQCVSIACSATLPTRIGGLDQIAAKRTSSGTSSGRTARTLVAPRRSALRRVRSSARSLTSTAQTRRGGGRQRQRQRDRTPAAAEVEQVTLRPAARGRGRAAPACRGRRGPGRRCPPAVSTSTSRPARCTRSSRRSSGEAGCAVK